MRNFERNTDVLSGPAKAGPGGTNHREILLVAIEPRCYAQALGPAISEAQPLLDVRVIEPDDIKCQVRLLGSCLILCSRPRPAAMRQSLRWIEYYPYARNTEPEIRIDGHATTIRDTALTDLLKILNQIFLDRVVSPPDLYKAQAY